MIGFLSDVGLNGSVVQFVFTRVHVRNDPVDCDGSDLKASQHFAEPQPFIIGIWIICSRLQEKQMNYD